MYIHVYHNILHMCASPLECGCIVKPSIHEDVLVCVCVALTQHNRLSSVTSGELILCC